MNVFITRRIPDAAKDLLVKNGISVKVFPYNRIISRDELLKNARNAHGIISLLTEKFDSSLIDELGKCKVIANYAVGFNNIDIEYAAKNGITVTNTPDVLTDATAEIASALIISCARLIPQASDFMKSKKFSGWEPGLFKGIQLSGKVLGIVGAGRIGRATAQRMRGFGCKIIYFSRSRKEEFEKRLGAKKVSLNKLMKEADFISIHVPLNKSTNRMLDSSKLDLMKSTAILVNTARGEIIDEKHLIRLLKEKKIFSAGFDVYENEPKVNPDLLKLKNVVLLPHIGSATFETRDQMALLAAENIIRVLKGKKALTPVN
jgi:glyoxylate reductase